MHAKPDLRVVLEWMIAGSGSVITAVISPMKQIGQFGIRALLLVTALAGIGLACANYYHQHNDWGDFSGRIVDQNDPATGMPNVLVLLVADRGTVVPEHESFENLATRPVTVSITPSGFDKEFVLVRTGQELTVVNNDLEGHSVYPISFNSEASGSQPAGRSQTFVFEIGDRIPGFLECEIDQSLRIPLMISEHPYMATTNDNGEFLIPNVPAGKWKFMFWHLEYGYLSKLTIPKHKIGRRGDAVIEMKGFFGTKIGIAKFPITPKAK